jgi:competence CoiA-like predicted nuclease
MRTLHKCRCVLSVFASHSESPAHREAKIFLATHLKDEFKEYTTATFEYEVSIPQVKRVVDVLVTFPMGWRVAHEVQLAAITVDELYQRSADYKLVGIDVVWWLGKSANTPANRRWCEESFGYALSIYEQE